MRIDIVSKEFPPAIYGGAGVHVAELSRVLAPLVDLNIRCFGEPREPNFHGAHVQAYRVPADVTGQNPVIETLGTDVAMVSDLAGADVIHSHTWYANMAGHLGSLMHGAPHVISAHSLEPLRPWKAEQLGGGYAVSSYVEKTAYANAAAVIAVSEGMRSDILRCYPEIDPHKVQVVHNGVDVSQWVQDKNTDVLERFGIDPGAPSVVFVGRVTRQKGLPFLLRAVQQLPPEVQIVLCAGAADTPELAAEVNALITELKNSRNGVVLIDSMLPRREVIQILSHATVFACPSIYEPLGIVNLEAMACGAAVVATATGGIPEVVDDGTTGRLVSIEQVDDGSGTPLDPDTFVADFSAALHEVIADPEHARVMGAAGRVRAEEYFSWETIAQRTLEVYRSVVC